MIHAIDLSRILFIDIETVPLSASFGELDERSRSFWEKKATSLNAGKESTAEEIYPRAGIYAEFGKIICIGTGFFHEGSFRLRSFAGDDEGLLLREFKVLLERYYNTEQHYLCAHNGKEFDFPFIARRMIINQISLPAILDLSGKKPWEVRHLDTMELWKFGDRKNYTSLDLLTHILRIPSPKTDMNGSDVWRVYWQDKDLEAIRHYCNRDVIAVANVMQRFLGLELVPEERIIFTDH